MAEKELLGSRIIRQRRKSLTESMALVSLQLSQVIFIYISGYIYIYIYIYQGCEIIHSEIRVTKTTEDDEGDEDERRTAGGDRRAEELRRRRRRAEEQTKTKQTKTKTTEDGWRRSTQQMIQLGASSGIGAETARVLALRGAHVIMGVRNMGAGEEVKEAIANEVPAAKIDVMELDLSSIASVRKFALDFASLGIPLNLLINNAGIGTHFMLSKDNIELQFATNHLGHFLLTNLLLDTIKKTSRETKREGRIVNVSSEGHRFTYREGIRFDNINDEAGYSSARAYGQSKLANILHANELGRRLKEDGAEITANSLHPGAITTNLYRSNSLIMGLVNKLGKYVLKNVQQGAATTCYVALHPQVKGISGEYFADNNLAKASSQATDVELARKLWDFSATLVKK